MNRSIRKMRQERDKNAAKISRLAARNKKLDEMITEAENVEIIGAVRALKMDADQLAAFIAGLHQKEAPVFDENEDNEEAMEDENDE